MWMCVCPAGIDGLPRERGGLPAAGRTERLAGTGAPPSAPHKGCSCSRWEAGAQLIPHPLISLSVPRNLRELPSGLCWWLDSEGVPATWFPLVWGLVLQEWRVSWTPTLLSVPLLTAQPPQGVEPKHVGSEGGPGTSRAGGVRPSEWRLCRRCGVLGCVCCGRAGP